MNFAKSNDKISAREVISYASLDRQFAEEKSEILDMQSKILASGQYILGEIVNELEIKIAEYCGVSHCVSLNSGTDALLLGMLALGIGRGDEVITPPNSFVASSAAIAHIGAKPVFVDVADDQNIDVANIERAITSKTKAIMPVHLTGRICDMDKIESIAKQHGLAVVEDAAQSFGSKYKGRAAGSFGDVACFSAHPLKVFNACGDAGFVTTNRDDLASRIRTLRAHGMVDRNTVKEWGVVSRLDALQAGILLVRLAKIDDYIKRRRRNVETFKRLISSSGVYIAPCKECEYNSFQTFVVRSSQRDELQAYLLDAGIHTSVHYPVPIHLQPAAAALGYKSGDMPETESQAKTILSVPVSQFLRDEEVVYIANTINNFFLNK
jgi:dTDP-4-amino-4,6-dideoxygalactose transaminase